MKLRRGGTSVPVRLGGTPTGRRARAPSCGASSMFGLLLMAMIGAMACEAFPASAAPLPPNMDSAMVSPAFERAIKKLGSTQFSTRQKAGAAIRAVFAAQVRRMINAQKPEPRARLLQLLEFNENLSRWARAVMRQPVGGRKEMLDWGLSPGVAPLVADAFSERPSIRAKAADGLAALFPQSSWIIEKMLNDRHRVVYLTTLNAIWSLKPSRSMVMDLWRWSVISGYPTAAPNVHSHIVNFRGQLITVMHFVNYWQRIQDSAYAAQVLAHWNPPELGKLLTAFARSASMPNTPAAQTLSSPTMVECRNYLAFFKRVRPKGAVAYLLRILGTPAIGGVNFNFNNQQVHWDNHTTIVYLLVLAANQKPASYHFFRSQLYGGSWLTSTPGSQLAAQNKIVAWWHRHGTGKAAAAKRRVGKTRVMGKTPVSAVGGAR